MCLSADAHSGAFYLVLATSYTRGTQEKCPTQGYAVELLVTNKQRAANNVNTLETDPCTRA